jgi:hypothetical protein
MARDPRLSKLFQCLTILDFTFSSPAAGMSGQFHLTSLLQIRSSIRKGDCPLLD